jgi:hypothetical protein
MDVLRIPGKPLQLRAGWCSSTIEHHEAIVFIVIKEPPPNLSARIHRCVSAHVPIPQIRNPQIAPQIDLHRLHKSRVDKGLSNAPVPFRNNLHPRVPMLCHMDQRGLIHYLPHNCPLALNEGTRMPGAPLVLINNPHAVAVNTALFGGKIWARAFGFVHCAVLKSCRGKTRTHQTPGSLCPAEVGRNVFVETHIWHGGVLSAECIRSPDEPRALVVSICGGCADTGRHLIIASRCFLSFLIHEVRFHEYECASQSQVCVRLPPSASGS